MRKPPLAERFLSLTIGAPRASALYGDLEELSPTRGRLWFWSAYIRALIPFAWRIGISIVALAVPCYYSGWINLALGVSMQRLFHWVPYTDRYHVSFWIYSLWDAITSLLLLLPFVLFRFGLRDRLAQLTCAIFLICLPCFSLRPYAVEYVGAVIGATVFTALCLRQWRQPMIILAMTLAARYAFVRTLFILLPNWVYRHFNHVFIYLLSASVAAIVCMALHRRLLLQHKPTNASPVIA
jgi:hypothetical protein